MKGKVGGTRCRWAWPGCSFSSQWLYIKKQRLSCLCLFVYRMNVLLPSFKRHSSTVTTSTTRAKRIPVIITCHLPLVPSLPPEVTLMRQILLWKCCVDFILRTKPTTTLSTLVHMTLFQPYTRCPCQICPFILYYTLSVTAPSHLEIPTPDFLTCHIYFLLLT